MIGPSLNFVGMHSLGKRSEGLVMSCTATFEKADVVVEGVSFECWEQPNGTWLSVIRTCSLGRDRTGRVPL